jgi:glycosyltransferase involved in cell wall biosynthesis
VIIYDFTWFSEEIPDDSSYSSGEVLYRGGSSTSKGFYTIVEALEFLESRVKILFAGKYVETEKPRGMTSFIKYFLSNARIRNKAIDRIKKHPNAVMTGLIYNVNDYLDKVSCIVSPFTVPHFSFPVVEAFMRRKAAVGSDVEGMEEVISHGKNGLIVPKNNPRALAEAINKMTSEPATAKAFGEEGFKMASEKFTPTNIRLFEEFYEKILDRFN